MVTKTEVLHFLEECSTKDRMEIFQHLRKSIPIHQLEKDLNTTAEVILEAMARSGDLTMRGLRGIIAEAAFLVKVVPMLTAWHTVPIVGDHAYDFLLENDEAARISVQVKMQRKEKGEPKVRKGKFAVETQRTRGGVDQAGEPTRPYRFGEFDILAVSLHPSTGEWTTFAYTVGSWLRPRVKAPHLLEVMQPIPQKPDEDWTHDISTCIRWFLSGQRKTIAPF
jgi:hypothetical protein